MANSSHGAAGHVAVRRARPEKDPTFRLVRVTLYSSLMGFVGATAAVALSGLIAFFAHLTYEGRLSFAATKAPELAAHLGWWAALVPALAGIVIGLMAKYGTEKIRRRGHPRSHGRGAQERQQDRRAHRDPQADLCRAVHGFGWPVRRRGPDHPDERRHGLASSGSSFT